jgi:hypothetical protein
LSRIEDDVTERFRRVVTSRPVVNYNDPQTWTDEVKALHRRLQDGDVGALAPLVAIDVEFISNADAIKTLVLLKYDPALPSRRARLELRRIANAIQKRPRLRGEKLPGGDQLLPELNYWKAWIERHGLLAHIKNPGLEEAINQLLAPPAPPPRRGLASTGAEIIDDDGTRHQTEAKRRPNPRVLPQDRHAAREAIMEAISVGTGRVRTARSWAMGIVAARHGVDRKAIEKKIARDPLARPR